MRILHCAYLTYALATPRHRVCRLQLVHEPQAFRAINDVYDIFEGRHEPMSGAARASAAVDGAATLTAFSGDVLSPSALTPATLGAKMRRC